MNLIWVAVAVLVVFAVVFFIDKKTFVDWVVKGLEIVAVALLSLLIAFAVGFATQETAIGTIAVGIVFYFFGAIIHPYIIELVKKLTKNIGKKTDEKKSK